VIMIPQNEHAEKGLLGLIARGVISPAEAIEMGVAECQFIVHQGLLTELCNYINEGGESVNEFCMQLADRGILDELGTAAVITDIANNHGDKFHLNDYVKILRADYNKREIMQALQMLALNLTNQDALDKLARAQSELAGIKVKSKRQPLVAGVNGFPTDPPLHTILVGNCAIRIGDIAMLNSGAGMGKSVSMGQMAMAWALGLPYFGIKPARPLRILHYVGEDDEATMGQIREGFLLHSLAITGRRLTTEDLEQLDEMLKHQFDLSAIGENFIHEIKSEIEVFQPDIVFINPLLSYIGGDPVALVTPFLRGGLVPLLREYKCASLIAHHTCKLTKESWKTMDMTYSGIGGGDVANIPRIVFTLAPTDNEGLVCLHVAKRTTVGWKDEDGKHKTYAFFRRTDEPTRPAWLPVSYEEAERELSQKTSAPTRKCTADDVVAILRNGDGLKTVIIEELVRDKKCVKGTAENAIKEAMEHELVRLYDDDKPNPNGGSRKKWLTIQNKK
jgi:hypothetical protein